MQVKGTAVVSIPQFVEQKFGKEGLARFNESMPTETRNIFENKILVGNWYDVHSVLITATRAVCNLFYNGDTKGAWELGRSSADYGLKGPYKLLLKLITADSLIERSLTLITNYYQPINAKIIERSKTATKVQFSDMDDWDEVLSMRIGGWIERAMEIAGCKDVKVVQENKSPNPTSPVVFSISWV